MPSIANLVQQTTTSTGSGALTLSALNGRRSFDAAFGSGGADVFFYFISHKTAAEWEIGTGHMNDAATLVRDTVIASSSGSAAVNFSAGDKDVVNDIPASYQQQLVTLAADLAGKQAAGSYLTGNQTITLSGDLTGSGATSIAATLANGAVSESKITLSDTTTLDVDITRHGLAPKAPNDTAKFLRGDGTWAVPPDTGEANTGANVGTAGIGVFKQKAGVSLELKKINAGSSKITLSDDTANSKIDIDVAEGSLTLGNLGGSIDLGSAKASGTLAAARFPALSGDVTTTAGNLSTAIANDAITNAKLADVATATIKGRTTAGTGDPEDLTATQATALLDTFTSALKGLAPASGGGTANYLRADGTWATPSGGSGSPGGSTGQVQYNNAGAFGGMAGLGVDANGYPVLGAYSSTHPATPSAGNTLFSRNRAGRTLASAISTTGSHYEMQPAIFTKKAGLVSAVGNGVSLSNIGISAGSATGTATARNVASTSMATSTRYLAYVSAGTAGASAGNRLAVQQFWRGNASGLGGFFFCCRFVIDTVQTDMRWFVGLNAATADMANVNPSSRTDMCGFGIDSAQTTVRWMINDSTGTATMTDLGANFPATTAGVVYEARIFCKPNDSVVYYSLERFDSAQFSEGSSSSDLPTNTTFMQFQSHINNGTTAAAVALGLVHYYIETEV